MGLKRWIKYTIAVLCALVLCSLAVQIASMFNQLTPNAFRRSGKLEKMFVGVEQLVESYCSSLQQSKTDTRLLLSIVNNISKANVQTAGENTRDTVGKSNASYASTSQTIMENHTNNLIEIASVAKRKDDNLFQMQFNSYEFENVISPMPFCKSCVVDFVLFVHSSVANRGRRNLIRQAWGAFQEKYHTRVIFILGMPLKKYGEDQVTQEANKYGDILQQSFADTYNNLVWKSVTSLLFFKNNCSGNGTRFLVKTDDDILINIKRLRDLIRRFKNQRRLIIGSEAKDVNVKRNGRNQVLFEEYPQSTFPVHLNGGLYILSKDVVVRFCELYENVPMIPLENVYITGLLATEAGFVLTRFNSLFSNEVSHRYHIECDFIRGRLITIHGYEDLKATKLWERLLAGSVC